MRHGPFLIRARRTILPGGEAAASVHIGPSGGIARVGAYDEVTGVDVIDLGDLVLMPGVVDTHVHVNEPGRTEWEGFDTATRAAAAGGVTTIVDMPLNSVPPTTSVAALEVKRRAASGRIHVDVGFWGGVVPDNVDDLVPLARAGVLGFKCFLVPSGVEEFPHVEDRHLRAAATALAEAARPLLAHAEWPALIDPSWAERADPRSYRAYAASRSAAAEARAIDRLAEFARAARIRVHIVHVSSAEGCDAIARAQRTGDPVTGETCPHYLAACADEIGDGATLWKCAPPIRSASDRDALWRALGSGVLTLVGSDHSPSPLSLKHVETGDFARAWGGISSLQLALSIVWTGAVDRGRTLADVVRWMCAGPAALAGIDDTKGSIAAGHDADLVAFDPDAAFTVDAAALSHRHPATPYEGRRLRGRVARTWVRGRLVYDRGRLPPAEGALIARFH